MATLIRYEDKFPKISEKARLAPNCVIVGDVQIAEFASVWFGAVIRGDINYVRIGPYSNIQDNCVIHVTPELYPVEIGSYVTVGHGAVIHGAKVADLVIIGMNAVLLDGVKVGRECIVGAGAVVPPGMEVPDRSLVVGVPAKVVRTLKDEEVEMIKQNALIYLDMAKESFK